MTSEVTPTPAAPVVPPYPALGSSSFNEQAYAFGTAMPGVAARIHEIAEVTHSNAQVAYEAALEVSQGVEAAQSAAAAAEATSGAQEWVAGDYEKGDAVWSPLNLQTYRKKVTGPSTTDPSVDKAGWERITYQAEQAWVSGTYVIGETVYSPSNLLSYRRKTNGAGTTDPANDKTNWLRISGPDALPWVSGAYDLHESAISPSNSQTYRCKVPGNRTTDPALDAVNWEKISGGSDVGTLKISIAQPQDGVWLEAGNAYLRASYPALASVIDTLPHEFETGPALPAGQYRAMTRVGDRCVAVGGADAASVTCAVLDSGSTTWSARTTIPPGIYHAITVSDGRLIAVGANVCAISDDGGDTWTAKSIPTGVYYGVAGVPGSLSCAAVGVNVLSVSTNKGDSWAAATIPAGTYNAVSGGKVAGPSVRFVAVGNGVAAASPTTISNAWTSVTISGNYYALVSYQDTAQANNFISVAVGTGVARTATSSSTAGSWNWTAHTIPAGTYRALVAADGQLLAVGDGVSALGPQANSSAFVVLSTKAIPTGDYKGCAWMEDRLLAITASGACVQQDNTYKAGAAQFFIPALPNYKIKQWVKAA